MTNTRPVFILLPLLLLACTLTTQHAVMSPTSLPEQTTAASPTQTLTPTPLMCQVKTGMEAGALNLRTCGSIDCPIASVLHEGESLTQTRPQAVSGWIAVRTASGLTGWVNSNYLDCSAQNAGLK